jgi:hypothetical protein
LRSHTILKRRTIGIWRTIGTKEEQLEQLEYGEDFCCCRSMMHICSLVDKVNSRVQRGSCSRTSVSKEFHKKPAEALLAGEAYYAFYQKNENQLLPHFVAEILETYTLTYIYPAEKKSLLLLEDQ